MSLSLKKCLLVFLVAASSLTHAGEISDKVIKEKKIVIGTEGTFPPYTFRDGWGHLTGFDVEVAREIGKVLGWEVEFKEIEWKKMFNEFDTYDIHTIANQIAISPERQKKYDMSDSYVHFSDAVAIRKGDKSIEINSFNDLKGVSVSISKSNSLFPVLTKLGAKVVPNHNGSLAHSMKALMANKVNAVVNIDLALSEYISKNPNLNLEIVYRDEGKTYAAFPFQKGEEELVQKFNEAIAKLRENGTLSQLSERWFGQDNTK